MSRKKQMSKQERAFHKAFGLCLTRSREKMKLSQVQVAAVLDIAQQTYAAYENGRNRLPLFLVPLLAELLRTDANALLDVPVRRAPKRRTRRA
jgi:transcriptional regulator with XRE-family HTH domain